MLSPSSWLLPALMLTTLGSGPAESPAAVPARLNSRIGTPACANAPDIAATLAHVRMGDRTGAHYVSVVLALSNAAPDTLTLGYVTSALVVSDTSGRLLALTGRALGMEPISGTQFDAGIALAPQGRDSLLLDFQWESSDAPPVIPAGLRVIVSQVVPDAAHQKQVCPQWQLEFRSLAEGAAHQKQVCPQWQLEFRSLAEGESATGSRAVAPGIALGAASAATSAGGSRTISVPAGSSDDSRQGITNAARGMLQIIPKKP